MAENGVRFTAWFSPAEDEGLRAVAKAHGTSINYVIRMAVRAGLGLERPSSAPIDQPARGKE